MRLGIDFGTTRTVVAGVDRGNYPVLTFVDSAGDSYDSFPSEAAVVDGRICYGFEAQQAARSGSPVLRSFKRTLAAPDVNPQTPVAIGDLTVPILDLLVGYFTALREALAQQVTLGPAMIAVPAHAHSAQRFITLEAFRRAGFTVAGMLNEPSAAGFEYTQRQPKTITANRTRVIVYDFGGGTFDASLVDVSGLDHQVLNSIGINRLGGDDFDTVLTQLALDEAGLDTDSISVGDYFELLLEARDAKERIAPQTKRIVLDVDGDPVTIAVDDFYAAAAPLVTATLDAMAPLVGGLDAELTDIAGIYLVGGASGLPLVPRMLREVFARRVHRSPHPTASTAIGLAIAADETSGYSLTDRLSRGFGVFREGSHGTTLHFDPLLSRDERISATSETTVVRRYQAAHNIGVFRFVEYADLTEAGDPKGDLVPFAEVAFAFDPALQAKADLAGIPVERQDHGPQVEELYRIDPHGIIEVKLTDLDTGHTKAFTLGD